MVSGFLGYCTIGTIVLESVGLDFDSEHAEYPASNSLCRLVLAPPPQKYMLVHTSNIFQHLPTSSNIFQHISTIPTISWCRKSDAYHETVASTKRAGLRPASEISTSGEDGSLAAEPWWVGTGGAARSQSGWINGVYPLVMTNIAIENGHL